ncbi:hypothetical protein P20439_2619 [Pseudoalteromonas sp. BSi20439]|nr:hypothetical protein P20439_2619 [Pseudoalteromonas sp. BSi20439]
MLKGDEYRVAGFEPLKATLFTSASLTPTVGIGKRFKVKGARLNL